jgi:energy-coupling factor transporter ATP-binding protein EcfA2
MNEFSTLKDYMPREVGDGSGKIILAENDYLEFESSQFLFYRKMGGRNTKYVSTETTESIEEVAKFLCSEYPEFVYTEYNEYGISLLNPDHSCRIVLSGRKRAKIKIHGDQEIVETINNQILAEFNQLGVMIDWVYSNDGSRFSIPLSLPSHKVTDTSYPFIEGGVAEFVSDFAKSSENILVLMGPPGTGKSTFLKYLLQEMNAKALVTYDPEILHKDFLFGDFIEGDYGALIMEDADTFLESRSTGNQLMHKFLNVGDGLISTKNKKIIFSTNIESSDGIDQALLRPGRCFAVMNFRPLTRDESRLFMKEHDPEYPVENLTETEYTLAELYNETRNRSVKPKKSKFGFV